MHRCKEVELITPFVSKSVYLLSAHCKKDYRENAKKRPLEETHNSYGMCSIYMVTIVTCLQRICQSTIKTVSSKRVISYFELSIK